MRGLGVGPDSYNDMMKNEDGDFDVDDGGDVEDERRVEPDGAGLVGPEDEAGTGSFDIDGSLTGGRRVWWKSALNV